MKRLALFPGLLAVAVLGMCPAPVTGAGADSLASPQASAPLVRRLAAAGRAEVPIVRRYEDPMTGEARAVQGRLVLEPPDRARISFDSTGERITLRADGGEWLQPQLEQMLRFDAARAMAGLRWWVLFGRRSKEAFVERRIDAHTWIVRMKEASGVVDSARVELGDDGLPHRIEIVEPGTGAVTYELGAWRFARPRGRKDFVLHAPKGYEVFDMP